MRERCLCVCAAAFSQTAHFTDGDLKRGNTDKTLPISCFNALLRGFEIILGRHLVKWITDGTSLLNFPGAGGVSVSGLKSMLGNFVRIKAHSLRSPEQAGRSVPEQDEQVALNYTRDASDCQLVM